MRPRIRGGNPVLAPTLHIPEKFGRTSTASEFTKANSPSVASTWTARSRRSSSPQGPTAQAANRPTHERKSDEPSTQHPEVPLLAARTSHAHTHHAAAQQCRAPIASTCTKAVPLRAPSAASGPSTPRTGIKPSRSIRDPISRPARDRESSQTLRYDKGPTQPGYRPNAPGRQCDAPYRYGHLA